MKKILIFLLCALSFATGFSQTGNDTTKYSYFINTYGNKFNRSWAKYVSEIPNDTIWSKSGIAKIGNILYVGNGAWWTAANGSGGAFVNPMTTPGDIIRGGLAGAPTRFPGNTTTARQVYQSIYDGTNSVISLESALVHEPTGELPGDIMVTKVPGVSTTNQHTTATYTDGVVGNGCPVVWTGSGLIFTVGLPCSYNIGGNPYSLTTPVNVTLPAADPSNPKFVSIVVNTSSTATYVDGVAQVNPEIPDVDQTSQLYLTAVFVDAGATTPTQIGQFVVRDVNYAAGEWFMSRTATIDSIYATNPYHSTLSVRLTAATNNQYFQYNSRAGALFSKSAYTYLVMYVRNNSVLNNNRTLTVRLFNGATQVGNAINLITYGYVKGTTGTYQTVAIPTSAFAGADAFTSIRITNTGTGGTVDVQFDYVQLQSGISPPTPANGTRFGLEDNSLTTERAVNLNQHDFNFYNGSVYIGAPNSTKIMKLSSDGTRGSITAASGAPIDITGGSEIKLRPDLGGGIGFLNLKSVAGLPVVNLLTGGNTSYMSIGLTDLGGGNTAADIGPENGGFLRFRNIPNGTIDSSLGIDASGNVVKSLGSGGASSAEIHDSLTAVRAEGIILNEPETTTGSLIQRKSDGEYETFTKLIVHFNFKVGVTTDAPVNGDDHFINSYLKNKTFTIFKNGLKLDSSAAEEWTFDNSTGDITFATPLATNDIISIEGSPTIYHYWPDYEAPPPSYTDLDFPTQTALLQTGTVWTPTTVASWAQYGLSGTTLTGDGRYIIKYTAADGDMVIIGYNASNTSEDYTHYEYGAYLSNGGLIYRVVSGTPTATSTTLSTGSYMGIHRVGSTFTVETSPDKITWTVIYTFAATSSATHYINLDVNQDGKCYDPQFIAE